MSGFEKEYPDDFILPKSPPLPPLSGGSPNARSIPQNELIRTSSTQAGNADNSIDSKAYKIQVITKSCGRSETVDTLIGTAPGEMRDFPLTSLMAIQMCWIPPGEFLMGSPLEESGRDDDEGQHLVKIKKGFWMSRNPVTQGQWHAVSNTRPSTFGKRGKLNSLLFGSNDEQWMILPVESVSWMDICGNSRRTGGFLGIVNLRAPDGWSFDLPSEVEWEYACRAGSKAAFNDGSDLGLFSSLTSWSPSLSKLGWYNENSNDKVHPVGEKVPNAWGLCDMHGNVWEWCSSCYEKYPEAVTNHPPEPPISQERVNRGGGWASSPKQCRSAFRSTDLPFHKSKRLGFRMILTSEQR